MKKDKKITSPVLAGLTGEDREIMVKQLLASEILLKRLETIIQKEINSLGTITAEDFDSPSWAFKQAYKLGLQKGLTKLLEYVIIYT